MNTSIKKTKSYIIFYIRACLEVVIRAAKAYKKNLRIVFLSHVALLCDSKKQFSEPFSPLFHFQSTTSKHALSLFLVLLFHALSLSAQTEHKSTSQKEHLLKEIQRTNRLLKNTKRTQASVLGDYYVLQRQLEQRASLISTIQKEINQTTIQVEQSAISVDSLELEIDALKSEYATILQQAYRQRQSRSNLLLLFSATSFNQALKRWRYLQQYQEYRKKQVNLIIEAKKELKERIQQLSTDKEKQQELLLIEESQKKAVQEEMLLKDEIIALLKEEEKEIVQLLREQEQAHSQLTTAVASVIDGDISERVEVKMPAKRSLLEMSAEFARKKGVLTWPLQNGRIVRYFGSQPHPIHKKILINNNGIDIRALSDRTVFSLFEGTVAAIQAVPGYRNALILKHGDYYTVYSNLESVKVRKGDFIVAQQAIGIAGISIQRKTPELHLEIWKGKQRLNPSSWLKKL